MAVSIVLPQALQRLECPSFIVVRGEIYYSHGGFEGFMGTFFSVRYRKHGWFKHVFAKDDYGIIEHMQMATGGTKRPIFIPPKKRLYVHKGQWRIIDVNYESHIAYYAQRFPHRHFGTGVAAAETH